MKIKLLLNFFIMFFSVISILSCPVYADEKNTRVVEDCYGRKVEIPTEVKKIVCLFSFSGHAAVMLGRGKDIVAVSNGIKRDTLLLTICPSIQDAAVPKYKGAINIEELIKSKPDLAFISGDIGRNAGEAEKLNRFKIPYLIVDYSTIEKQQFAIAMIADALGVPEKGDAYLDYYNTCIELVQKRTKDILPDKKARIFHSVLEPTRTDPKQSLTTDWIRKANAVSVSAERDLKLVDGKGYAGMEQILLWNPDMILVNEPSAHSFILKDVRWSALKAVKNKKVFQMPIGISRWGHPGSIETPLAILWAAKTLYPDLFKDINIRMETRQYYKRFFDFELSDELLEQILDGTKMRKKKRKQKNK
jgi:iron complex transport system substrate-binding protein